MRDILFFSLFIFILGLSGCTKGTKSFLGLTKTEPDEFTVIPNEPLIVPPTFDLPNPYPNIEKSFDQPKEKKEDKKKLPPKNKKSMYYFMR